MKYTNTSGIPLSNRRRGVVFNAQPQAATARATAIPVQPTTNPQTAATMGVSAVAANWLTLNGATQALWAAVGAPSDIAYNNFLAYNTLQYLWGTALADAPPTLPTVGPVIFAQPYSEPDGVTTTLAILTDGTPLPGIEKWIRLYVDLQPSLGATASNAAGFVFVGSFGPLAVEDITFFDFTQIQTDLAGQWWYPASVDTTTGVTCGSSLAQAHWYVTDQFGRLDVLQGFTPTVEDFFYQGGPVAPGACPFLPGPPYPWPTSAEFYGTLMAAGGAAAVVADAAARVGLRATMPRHDALRAARASQPPGVAPRPTLLQRRALAAGKHPA
jgi:hypothetical protein